MEDVKGITKLFENVCSLHGRLHRKLKENPQSTPNTRTQKASQSY